MKEGKLSVAQINNLLAAGKSTIWIDSKTINKTQALAFLKNGASLVVSKENEEELPSYLKITKANLFILPSDFIYNELYDLIQKKNKNLFLLFNKRWDEAELTSLILKGKNKIIINGNDFSKEELLVFAGKGAQVILNNQLELPDIKTFLSLPNKNIFIRSEGFTQAELHSFLQKGANLIVSPITPEDEIDALFSTGKDKVFLVSNVKIWKY